MFKAFIYFTPDDLKKFNGTLIETRKQFRELNEVDLNGLSEKSNLQVHDIFIKDIDRVVGGYLCQKCSQKLFNRTSDNFSRDLKKHIQLCKGPDQQKHPKLDKFSQPLMPDKEYQEYVDDFISSQPNSFYCSGKNDNRKFKYRRSYLEYNNIREVECIITMRGKTLTVMVITIQKQDIKVGIDITNNVTADDREYFNQMIPDKCCYFNAKFTNVNNPTLELSDNNTAHTKDNCKLSCQLCNSTRSNKDADVAKFMIQMNKYAIIKNLPMTIDDKEVYWFLRKSIHAYRDTKRKEMIKIINSEDRFSEEKGQLFIASVKGLIDKNHINDHINFPPI
ncbi:MAG: hypothetical protein EZS28_008489 [Streblomastix strix]|uniref:Uncharacterized protein n=1 Tax=Streblomastix strix TaxID=222440 RepID=A0A5J4WLX7_9EUKA|nr:MAG: hypothetical protein EZS28_008489 [Streblomastix strix]